MMRTTEKDLKDKQEIIHRDLLRWLRNYDESQNSSEIRNQSGGVLQMVRKQARCCIQSLLPQHRQTESTQSSI